MINIKEKRSLFNMFFGKKDNQTQTIPAQTILQLLNGQSSAFTSFSTDIYSSDAVRSAVDAIARHGAKLKPKHVRKVPDSPLKNTNSSLDYILQVRTNKYIDAYTFFYKVFTNLFVTNNSFIYVRYDDFGRIEGLYPINTSYLELLEMNNQIYCKFSFLGGSHVTLPYEEIIHLRRFFYENDFYGENNSNLTTSLETLDTVNQGFINAIKTSGLLKGIIKVMSSGTKEADIKAKKDRFVEDYLNITNDGGIAALDNTSDYIPLESKPQMAEREQLDYVKKQVYNYFGINEAIISGSYNEEQFQAFYSGTIEPIAIQLSNEFTYKLFTDRERGFGNQIIFSANRLMFASAATKTAMIRDLTPYGLFTINEAREIFELEPVDDGEIRLQTLNVVQTDKVNDYQGVGGNKKNGQDTKIDESSSGDKSTATTG